MPIATKSDKIELSSEKKTQEFAVNFSKRLKAGDSIFLHGEIGVGKTTFVRYLVNTFQKENELELTEVTSPTFNLLNEYKIKEININHYDLFRLKTDQEVKNLNIFENEPGRINLIEWPKIIKKKPKNLIELFFEYGKDLQKRFVQIKGLNL